MDRTARRNLGLGRIGLATSALLLATALDGQQPSAWTTLTLPATVDQNPLVQIAVTGNVGNGKLAMVRDGQYLRVFSTVTGKWHAFQPSFGTTPVLLHDILLVPESDRWTAFSAWRGVFEPLFVNYAATTLSTGRSIAVVRDGSSAWAFSAFTGQWHARTLPATWNLGINDRFAMFQDPTFTAFGGLTLFDALTGQWHDLPAQNANLVSGGASASTVMLLFRRPDQSTCLAIWSSDSSAWQLQDVAAVPPLFNQGGGGTAGSDFLAAWDLGYSGLSHTLVPSGIAYQPFVVGLVMTTIDTTTQTPWCLAIRAASWTAMPAGALLQDAGFYATPRGAQLFALGGQTLAYSGITGTWAATPSTLGGLHHGSLVAACADVNTGVVSVFSALTGNWQPTPAGTLAEPIVWPLRPSIHGNNTSVLLRSSSGVTAFSGRTGRFVPLSGVGLSRTDTFALDASTLWFFDARTDRWLATPQPTTWSTSDTAFVGASATALTGFGARSSRLEVLADASASSRVAYALEGGGVVQQSGKLFGFSGLPANLSYYGFPEDFTVCGPGTMFRQQLRLDPGSVALTGVSPRSPGPVSLPPYGDLWLDPANMILLPLVVSPPGEQRATMAFAVPDLVALRNTEWYLQSLVLPATGQPYLTDYASVFFL